MPYFYIVYEFILFKYIQYKFMAYTKWGTTVNVSLSVSFYNFFLKLSPSLTQSSNHFYSFSLLQCSGHVLCVDNSTFSLLVYRMTTLGSAGLLCIMFQFCKSGMVHSLTIFLPHCNALELLQRCYLCSWLYFSRSSKLQLQKKKVKLTKT